MGIFRKTVLFWIAEGLAFLTGCVGTGAGYTLSVGPRVDNDVRNRVLQALLVGGVSVFGGGVALTGAQSHATTELLMVQQGLLWEERKETPRNASDVERGDVDEDEQQWQVGCLSERALEDTSPCRPGYSMQSTARSRSECRLRGLDCPPAAEFCVCSPCVASPAVQLRIQGYQHLLFSPLCYPCCCIFCEA